jgi:uncharacterized protein
MILRILLLIIAAWLIRRFLAMFLGNKRSGTPKAPSDSSKNMVKDPMCGMYMDPRLAVKHEIKNGIYYFCSDECKNKYLKISTGKESGNSSSEE